MADKYDVHRVNKTSHKLRTNYFQTNHKNSQEIYRQYNSKQKDKKNKQQKKSSQLPNRRPNTKENYSSIERRLDINQTKWGVKAISNKILQLVKIHYKFKLVHSIHPTRKEILTNVYNEGQEAIKQGYKEVKETLHPIPPDINKLIAATYEQSSKQLTSWFQKETANHTEKIDQQLPQEQPAELTEKIPEILIKQAIYLKEGKTHLPAINLKA
jgi:hypothetical protein